MREATSRAPHNVTPDLIRGPAFFLNQPAHVDAAEGSWTPDQVRGDDGLQGGVARTFLTGGQS